LKRPKQWKPGVLEELRKTLRQNDYDEKKLRKAHEKVYRKTLADIISMVKHAARKEEPILTAEERVKMAMASIRTRHKFSEEQLQWLGFIEQHLIDNLSIDEDDLNLQPVFSDRGGLGRAKKLFGQELPKLIEELNLAITA
jgi:type I restriction enzyme R subunit